MGQNQRDQKRDSSQSQRGQGEQRDQTTGQGSRSQAGNQRDRDQTTGQNRRDQDRNSPSTQRDQRDQTPGQDRDQQNRDNRQGQDNDRNRQGAQDREPRQDQGQRDQARQGDRDQARGTVTLKEEERTRIRETVLNTRNVPRVDRIDFSLTVGAAVPRRVRVVEVPETLIRIHPEWRGHSYFVVRDEIIIVDRRHKVIATVPVGGSSAQLNRGGSINLDRDQIRELQIVLRDKGFDIGEPDGVMGTRTKEALIAFQRQEGFRATGQIDVETVTALGIKGDFGQRGGNQPPTTGQGNRPTAEGRNDDRDRDNRNQEARDRDQSSAGRQRDDSQRSGNQERDRTTGQGQDNRDSRRDPDRNDQPATTSQGRDNSQTDRNRNEGNRGERDRARGSRPVR